MPILLLRLRLNAETRAGECLIDAEVRDNSSVNDHVAFASRSFELTKQHLTSRDYGSARILCSRSVKVRPRLLG